MKPAYEQIRTFQTNAVHFKMQGEAQLEPRQEVLRSVVDGVGDFIRPTYVETTDKLNCTKVVDSYIDNAYIDKEEM